MKKNGVPSRKIFRKKSLIIPCIVTVLMLIFLGYQYFDNKNIVLNAKSAVVMSLDKNKVMFNKNMDKRLIPGSLTKLMSMLIVFEKINAGHISFDQKIYISQKATATVGSKAGLYTGEHISVDDLIKCVFLPSGSDAVIAFAEHLYGTQEAFVGEMNEKVKQLNLKNTHFANCIGLEDPEHYSSAHDIAIIADELTSRYPKAYEYTSLRRVTIKHEEGSEFMLMNSNDMLDTEGINGLKTGSTPNGGYSLAMTSNKSGKHLIFVVIGNDSQYFRKKDCKNLLSAFY